MELSTAYYLALRGKLEHLELSSGLDGYDDQRTGMLETVLSDCAPTALTISILLPGLDLSLLGRVLSSAQDTLTELHVSTSIWYHGGNNPDLTPRLVRMGVNVLRVSD